MKSYSLIFAIILIFVPSLSFAEQTKDDIINAHPSLDTNKAHELASSIISDLDDEEFNNDKDVKASKKKLDKLLKQEAELNEKEAKLNASYVECWSGCPEVSYRGNDQYQCYSQKCSKCGTNCNNRFGKAKSELEAKQSKLDIQLEEVNERLEDLGSNIYSDGDIEDADKAINAFNGCISGIIDNEAVYQKQTYSSLDECLNEFGWNRISK